MSIFNIGAGMRVCKKRRLRSNSLAQKKR